MSLYQFCVILKSVKRLFIVIPFLSLASLSVYSFAKIKQPTQLKTDTAIFSKGSFVPLYKHIAQTVRYPKAARENNITGNVIVSFTLNTDGRILDVNIEKGIRFGCDEEVKRSLLLFNDKSKTLKSGTYKLAVSFRLRGGQLPEAIDPAIKNESNFLSEITVTGF